MIRIASLIVLTFTLILGCESTDDAVPVEPDAGAVCEGPGPTAQSLQWKRTAAFTRDLMDALQLEASEVCTELETMPCAELHRLALGSNNPFQNTIYVPPAEPSVMTPLAMDRVAMAACSNRVALDAAASNKVVFRGIDLTAASVESPVAAREVIGALYRRLLRREASDEELEAVAELADERTPAAVFAKLACFSIATTTEFLLF